jgi:hypothetical protein
MLEKLVHKRLHHNGCASGGGRRRGACSRASLSLAGLQGRDVESVKKFKVVDLAVAIAVNPPEKARIWQPLQLWCTCTPGQVEEHGLDALTLLISRLGVLLTSHLQHCPLKFRI